MYWRTGQRPGASLGHVASVRLGNLLRDDELRVRLSGYVTCCETFQLSSDIVEGYDVPFQSVSDDIVVSLKVQAFYDSDQMERALSDFSCWPQYAGLSAVIASCRTGSGGEASYEDDLWLWVAAPAYFLDLRSLLGMLSDVLSGTRTLESDGFQYLDYVTWQEERRIALLSLPDGTRNRAQRQAVAALQLPCGHGPATSGQVSIRIPCPAHANLDHPSESTREFVRRHWSSYVCALMRIKGELHEVVRLSATLQLGNLPGVLEVLMPTDHDGEANEWSMLVDEYALVDAMQGAVGFGWHTTPSCDITVHATAGASCPLLLSGIETHDGQIQLLLSWQHLEWSRTDAQQLIEQFARRISSAPALPARSHGDDVVFSLVAEIARHAREHGGRVAISDESHTWSYSEFWRRAGVLASQLTQQVHRDCVVALWAETNAEAVLAMVACLRAGRIYLPIDPQTPPERLKWLMKNSGATLMLAPSNSGAPMLDDMDTWLIDERSSLTVESDATGIEGSSNAYLIYTSGSTGAPKGVTISRDNLDHYIEWAVRAYFDQHSRDAAVFSSLAFDMVVTPIFGCLASGGCLRLWPTTQLEDSLRSAFAPESGIGLIKLTPSHIDLIATLGIDASPVRTYIVGGEVLHRHQVGVLEQLNHGARIFNEYGPTEATVGCLLKQVSTRDHRITIGSPISRSHFLVVDDTLATVPSGDVGELLISGAGVAVGYWGDQELTERRFIRLLGSTERWYRTGDLVCELPNGEYEFFGRRDEQVKLRGYRIELGEIERTLLLHPDVNSAAVFLIQEPLPHLIACVESHGASSLGAELSALLARFLPAYMCPERIAVLPSFPLNSNGKLDRVRLQAACIAAPRGARFDSPVEQAMADLWAQALGLPVNTLSPDSHYQRLGGDSIRAIRLIGAVIKQFGVRLSIKQLYEHPTIQELTALCVAEMTVDSGMICATPEHNEVSSFPAPENSLGMLWLSQKHAGVHAYHIQNIYHTEIANFDVERLTTALQQLTSCHEALRSSFDLSSAEHPMQQVSALVTPDIRIHDLIGKACEQQQAIVTSALQQDRDQPFDVDVAGLWRMHVFLIEDGYQLLAWVHHHAILDGWSNAVLMRELVQRYSDPLAPLPVNPAKLREYASEQHQIRQDPALRTYWREQLDGAHPLTLFSHEQLKPGQDRWERKQILPPDIARGIRKLADELGMSVRDVCIGAFQRAISTVAYHSRTFIGLVENNRPLVDGGDALVGCFLNTIPLICSSTTSNWRTGLVNTAAQLRDLKHYGRLPLSDIASLGDFGLNQASAFQILFSYVDFHVYAGQYLPQRQTGRIAIHSYENTSIPLAFTTSSTLGAFEISVHSWLNDEAKRAADVVFNLYDGYLRNLAESGLDAPIPPLPDVMLSGSRRANSTGYVYENLSLWQLLQRQLVTGGGRNAIRFKGLTLSYDELSACTVKLADALRARGVVKGDRVVLVLDRSLHLPALLYAILAVGACYVPIDTGTPDVRVDLIVKQVDPRLVITGRELSLEHETALCQLSDLLAFTPTSTSAHDFHGEGACAYIIFTSGTTGVPKGVVVGDGAIVNRLLWMQRAYPLAADDVVLHKTPYSFDVSVWEFFWPIIAGCTLAVATPGAHLAPSILSATIREHGVSVVHFVPSMLAEFLPALRQHSHPSMRLVICSGEALSAPLVNTFFRTMSGCRLENLYGPTEAAVDVTAWSCAPDCQDVPIGKPIDNIQMHVVNESLQVLPDGFVGELCIAGIGLADCYWRQDAVTRRSFVDHASLETRIYRTGDLACWHPDGHLIYVGRIDHQVKLRGQRIELKEIDFHLMACVGGRRCLAMVVGAGTDLVHLAAFIESESVIDHDALIDSLSKRLPGYMIPRVIRSVAAFPVTGNGKLDRSSLVKLLEDEDTDSRDETASELENVLLDMWQLLLERRITSVNGNLYTLGAHSLLMIRVLSHIRERFGIQLDLKQFLECASVRDQATLLAREQQTRSVLDALSAHQATDDDIEYVL